MSVLISVVGGSANSDEYRAALKLKSIIQDSLPQSVIGEIVLYVSASLVGQTVKDVDLFMLGVLNNYEPKLDFLGNEGQFVRDYVSISSFCTTIEIKSHDISAISRTGTDFYVKYGRNKHCVTNQSNQQKISAMNFFLKTLSFSPYITNLIWFTEVTRRDLNTLLKVESKEMPSNVIGREFNFSDIAQLLVWQRAPYKRGKKYIFDSNYENCSISDIKKALGLFTRVQATMGNLTRQRIEMISRNSLSVEKIVPQSGKMTICRGRAGTGKTVALIQTAIRLVDEEYARVLILTYNKALVSDIRRLFALSELPDLFEENCVHVSTMHSFFYKMINECIYNGRLDGKEFVSQYDNYILEMLGFIKENGDTKQFIQEIMENNCYLNWNYILIDEAQDCTDKEQSLLTSLFENDHVIVADGGKQFVRNIEVCDWSNIRNRENLKLKYCLRQKNNLVKFINQFFSVYSGVDKRIISSDKLPGGRVIIVSNENKLYEILKDSLHKTIEIGNIAYDMLCLVPHRLVKKDSDNSFRMTREFEKNDIFLWDGTNEDVRGSYTVEADEIRVLQYDSARGLEGWSVCCLEIDQMVEEKKKEFAGKGNPLLLQSEEDAVNQYIDNWLMIAMTRAIDTLIITIKNPLSKEGRILKKLSEEYGDYVLWF